MQGVKYLVDDSGKKVAVQIDLKTLEEYWEDVFDSLIAILREKEPTIPWEDLKKELNLE